MGLLDGNVAVITGAASGIGRVTARRLADEGAAVVIGDVDAEGAAATAAAIEAGGGRALARRCDVADEASIRDLFAAAAATFGGVDLLDHNAAWSHPRLDGDAGHVDLEVWDRVLRTNTRGALLLARQAVPQMLERGGGAIVNISSGAASIGETTRVAYGVSKAGVEQLTRHLANRYGREGIRANAVAPGFILTDTAARAIPTKLQQVLADQNPSGRVGTPEDIADVVTFLLSARARYINGQVIHVDGGTSIGGVLAGFGD